jgi:hypothetical protein
MEITIYITAAYVMHAHSILSHPIKLKTRLVTEDHGTNASLAEAADYLSWGLQPKEYHYD